MKGLRCSVGGPPGLDGLSGGGALGRPTLWGINGSLAGPSGSGWKPGAGPNSICSEGPGRNPGGGAKSNCCEADP